MPLGEFDIIKQYFQRDKKQPGVVLGIGDDCALVDLTANTYLALTVDTLVAGNHFPADAAAADIASRSLCVNLSDLAAMGAKPLWFTLSLSLPEANESWLAEFSRGLFAVADRFDCQLVGGDTTRGPLSVTIQAHGSVPIDRYLTRAGAQIGDRLFVTGSLGDGAAALAMIRNELALNEQQANYLYRRFYQPEPQLLAAQKLLGISCTAIDISDGLLADLGHIASASQVAMVVDVDHLPLSPTLHMLYQRQPQRVQQWALAGGDDYQLAFTVATAKLPVVKELIATGELEATEIGIVKSGQGVECRLKGNAYHCDFEKGYQHFVSA
jgi:thiamine-monophosphate kinase